MSELFEITRTLTQQQFCELWEREEQASGHGSDGYTLVRKDELCSHSRLRCFEVRLTPIGLDSTAVPAHRHEQTVGAQEPGEALSVVVPRYRALGWQSKAGDCFDRLRRIQQYMDSLMARAGNLWESEFLLGRVFSPGDPTLPDFYRELPGYGLWALNFHRFVAYGLWCAEHGFQPARAHFFTGTPPLE
jgi:hypothetical protein